MLHIRVDRPNRQGCSMRRDDIVRLRHMLDAAREAIAFTCNRSRAALDSDRMLTLSLVKSIEIVGEAAARVSREY